jgi:Replicase family
MSSWQQPFLDSLPDRPYAGHYGAQNWYPRDEAISYPLIQPNHPQCVRWIPLELDRPDSALAWEECDLPPNLLMKNPENGHCHYLYRLAEPIHIRPNQPHNSKVRFFLDLKKSLTHTIGADQSYAGLLVKNPFHRKWITHSLTTRHYDLTTIADHIDWNRSARVDEVRRYESYLVGEAVMALATQLPDSESREDAPPCSSSAVVGHLGGTRSAPSGER